MVQVRASYTNHLLRFLFVINYINVLLPSRRLITKIGRKEIQTPLILPRAKRKRNGKERKEKGSRNMYILPSDEGCVLHLADPGGPQNLSTAPVCLSFDNMPRTLVFLGLSVACLAWYPNPFPLLHRGACRCSLPVILLLQPDASPTSSHSVLVSLF